jgi:uncharacterized SAM-binding protein YcdF (DUF218 family)
LFLYLSKLLPLLIYPLGLACLLLLALLVLRRRPRWVLGLGVAALLLLWLGGNRLVSMALVRSLEWQYLPPAELPQAPVIVLLGGGEEPAAWPQPHAGLNDAGERMVYAASLYQQGAAPHVLVSGGIVGVDGPAVQPGAEVMAELLQVMGVPEEAVWLEGRSRNTYENAVETKKLLDAQDNQQDNQEGNRRIILVTSALHMPRSQAIFARQGFEVIPAPTDYNVTQADWGYYLTPDPAIQVFNLFPSAEALDFTMRAMKEYIGIAVYRLRGWL